jgi:5-(carboxyamino)imidazole ribonucleotide mutase
MTPLVGVIMGSKSDWETLRHTSQMLDSVAVPYEVRVVSAHRTPDLLFEYAMTAVERGLEVIIAGAGGAAHLPGMIAGVPVGTLAIGRAGAVNAALLATAILGAKYPTFRTALEVFRARQTQATLDQPDPRAEAKA